MPTVSATSATKEKTPRVAERDLDWLFYTLKNQVMYLDTEDDRRFEISKVRQKNEKIFGDYNLFRVAEVTDPWKLSSEAMANENRPLGLQNVTVLFEEAEWESILWGHSSITVKDYVIENILSFRTYSSKIITVPDVISLDYTVVVLVGAQ